MYFFPTNSVEEKGPHAEPDKLRGGVGQPWEVRLHVSTGWSETKTF